MNFWDEKVTKRLFKELPFYNMFIEKPFIKHLYNIDLLYKLPFYNDLSTVNIKSI